MKRCRLHAGIADEATQPGHHTDLAGFLREHGLSDEEIGVAEGYAYTVGLRLAAEAVRQVALALPNTPEARALRIAMIGQDGATFEQHARDCGTTRGNLFRGVERATARLKKVRAAG